MKRVICIDGSRWPEDIGYEPLLEEGCVYHAEAEVYGLTSKGRNVLCYQLTEIELPAVYNVKRFIECQNEVYEQTRTNHELLSATY